MATPLNIFSIFFVASRRDALRACCDISHFLLRNCNLTLKLDLKYKLLTRYLRQIANASGSILSEVVYGCYTNDEVAALVSPPSREEEGLEALACADCVWMDGDGGGGSGASAAISLRVGIIWIPYRSS